MMLFLARHLATRRLYKHTTRRLYKHTTPVDAIISPCINRLSTAGKPKAQYMQQAEKIDIFYDSFSLPLSASLTLTTSFYSPFIASLPLSPPPPPPPPLISCSFSSSSSKPVYGASIQTGGYVYQYKIC